MKEIKLIAQPSDIVYYIEDDGNIYTGKVIKIILWGHQQPQYVVSYLSSDGELTMNTTNRVVVGNTVDELLQNLKNEYLQRTPSSQPITT